MEHNPYSPPTTSVADNDRDPVLPDRKVLIACKLMWVSFSLSIVGSASDVVRQSTLPLVIGSSIGLLIGTAIGGPRVEMLGRPP